MLPKGGRIGDNMNLRGFYTFGDLYLDGIRDVSQYNRDTFNLESVDVLRGGAAMLYGRGQAGGVISQTSKDAEARDFGTLRATVGTGGYARSTVDVNKRITPTTAFRLNAMKMDAGSTRDDVRNESEGIAPTVTFGLDTDNELSLSHFYLKTHITPDYGVPFYNRRPLDVSKNTYYGFTDDYEDNKVHMTTVTNKHRFDRVTEWKTTLRRAYYERDNWAIAPSGYNSTTGVVGRSLKGNGAKEETDTWQNDVTTTVRALGLRHEILVGSELLQEKQTRWGHTKISDAYANISSGSASIFGLPSSVSNGTRALANNGIYYQYSASSGTWSAQLPNTAESGSTLPDAYGSYYGNKDRIISGGYDGLTYALYGQDMVEIAPGWTVMAGMRRDWLRMSYYDGTMAKNGGLSYAESSYRGGVSYQPTPQRHYYLAWNNSFNTTGDLYSFSGSYKPEKSITYELGAKWELIGGDLSLRAAVYRTIKTWERNTDVASASSNPILSVQRHTDGIEFEAAGKVTARWDVFAGLAVMDARIDRMQSGKEGYIGKRPPNAADYTVNIWNTYALGGGWKIGGGCEGKSDRDVYSYRATPSDYVHAPNKAPGYIRYDAMVSYTQPRYAVQLNVKNLLNTTYYDTVYINGGFAVPAIGRTALVTLDYKF